MLNFLEEAKNIRDTETISFLSLILNFCYMINTNLASFHPEKLNIILYEIDRPNVQVEVNFKLQTVERHLLHVIRGKVKPIFTDKETSKLYLFANRYTLSEKDLHLVKWTNHSENSEDTLSSHKPIKKRYMQLIITHHAIGKEYHPCWQWNQNQNQFGCCVHLLFQTLQQEMSENR